MSWIDDMLTDISRDVVEQVAMGLAAVTLLLVAAIIVCVVLAIGPDDEGSTCGRS